MSSASAIGGSSIVTIRPTMTTLPPPDVALAALVGAGEPPAVQDGDGGALAPLGAQLTATASANSTADAEPNPLTDAGMGHLLARRILGGPSGLPVHRSTRGAWTHSPMRAFEGAGWFNPAHGDENAGGPCGPPAHRSTRRRWPTGRWPRAPRRPRPAFPRSRSCRGRDHTVDVEDVHRRRSDPAPCDSRTATSAVVPPQSQLPTVSRIAVGERRRHRAPRA